MNEVNIQAVDRSSELRQRVQSCLALAPVVLIGPIIRKLLHRRELHTLRRAGHRLLVGPLRSDDALTKVRHRLLRYFDLEGPNLRSLGRRCRSSLSMSGNGE